MSVATIASNCATLASKLSWCSVIVKLMSGLTFIITESCCYTALTYFVYCPLSIILSTGTSVARGTTMYSITSPLSATSTVYRNPW